MKIVVAVDSFKGTLSSSEASMIIADNLQTVQGITVERIPIADGGEGTVDALCSALNAEKITCTVTGPLFKPLNAYYAYSAARQLAIIELAQSSGLSLVPQQQRNPLMTTSFGLGELLRDAVERGAKKCIIGLGGSATNDGGSGMAEAIGVKFFAKNGEKITGLNGKKLAQVDKIDRQSIDENLLNTEITIASDVDNILLGQSGCARVFAGQKGATKQQIALLDQYMRHYSDVVAAGNGLDMTKVRGAGAAGGVAYGLLSFLNCRIKSGIEVVLDLIDFDSLLLEADLVITGEGRIDAQTERGKAPFGILQRAKRQHIDTICISGSAQDHMVLNAMGFKRLYTIVPEYANLEQALNRPKYYLSLLMKQVIDDITR